MYAMLNDQIKQLSSDNFEEVALRVFEYQYQYNPLYQQFVDTLGIYTPSVQTLHDIPLLPIEFFKTVEVKTNHWEAEKVFKSSGTTGTQTSRHYVRSLAAYRDNTLRGWADFYKPIEEYTVLALLPSYLEQGGSSLVFMAEQFIHLSKYPQSGFFKTNYSDLQKVLLHNKTANIPTLLLGVTYALLDFCEAFPGNYGENLMVMETGGMKGRRVELIREELHYWLKKGLGATAIHAEYGMTELLSQAYSQANGLFRPSATLRVIAKDTTDLLSNMPNGRTAMLGMIDLANLNSCAFLQTQDIGKVYADGSFEVLGRMDKSDVRGCNLLWS